jgi:hypothetical protein
MTERIQKIREWALYHVLAPIRWLFDWWMARKNLVIIYCVMGQGIGDALAISTILKSLNQQNGCRGIVFSRHPELFLHNPMVAANISYHKLSSLARSLFKTFLRSMRGEHVVCFGGEVWTLGTSPFSDYSIHQEMKAGWIWLKFLLPDGNVQLDCKTATPAIYFSKEEMATYDKKFAAIPRPFAMLKATTGVGRPGGSSLKDWEIAKFAEVIAQHPEITWVQVGQTGEPLVAGCLDWLGKTSVREVLYLLSKAKLLLATEGFLTHASAAFDVPCVIPFSGMHDYRGLLYPYTNPVVANPQPTCAPCWRDNCNQPGKPCTANITANQVSVAVLQGLTNTIKT